MLSLQVLFGTADGQVIVMDCHGRMLAHVLLHESDGIVSMSWNCPDFLVEDSTESDTDSDDNVLPLGTKPAFIPCTFLGWLLVTVSIWWPPCWPPFWMVGFTPDNTLDDRRTKYIKPKHICVAQLKHDLFSRTNDIYHHCTVNNVLLALSVALLCACNSALTVSWQSCLALWLPSSPKHQTLVDGELLIRRHQFNEQLRRPLTHRYPLGPERYAYPQVSS